MSLAYPEGYGLIPDVVERAREQARVSGGSLTVSNSMEEAFAAADIVYPKSWAPFGVMQKRTGLLRNGDRAGLAELERRCLAENARHQSWECDEMKMAATKGGKALTCTLSAGRHLRRQLGQGEVAASVLSAIACDLPAGGIQAVCHRSADISHPHGRTAKTLNKLIQRGSGGLL